MGDPDILIVRHVGYDCPGLAQLLDDLPVEELGPPLRSGRVVLLLSALADLVLYVNCWNLELLTECCNSPWNVGV